MFHKYSIDRKSLRRGDAYQPSDWFIQSIINYT